MVAIKYTARRYELLGIKPEINTAIVILQKDIPSYIQLEAIGTPIHFR